MTEHLDQTASGEGILEDVGFREHLTPLVRRANLGPPPTPPPTEETTDAQDDAAR